MKTKLVALMLMAGGALTAGTSVAIGVQIGRPAPVVVPAPIAVAAYQPPCPGPGYVWIDGYYDEFGNWYDGYWTLPPYGGAYWIAPRLDAGRFYAGYWNGPRGIYRTAPRVAPRMAPAPRVAAPYYNRGPERPMARPMPDRHDNGFRDRGAGHGGDFRHGSRR